MLASNFTNEGERRESLLAHGGGGWQPGLTDQAAGYADVNNHIKHTGQDCLSMNLAGIGIAWPPISTLSVHLFYIT